MAASSRSRPGPWDKPPRYLILLFCLLALLFAVSLFAHISYPLFWADEGMTVMHAERVLEYGYPKVHDGKNVLYDLRHPDPALGLDKKTDAYIGGANWGMYYFAAPFVRLAGFSRDIYAKTAIIRSAFALAGFAGLAVLALLGVQCFETAASKTGFLVFFAFFELISVPLVLHLREARYYPLAVLLVSGMIFVHARYRLLAKMGYAAYCALTVLALDALYVTFSPAYFIFLAALAAHESLLLAQERCSGHLPKAGGTWSGFAALLKNLLPPAFSLLTVYPLMAFFRTSYIAKEMAAFNALSAGTDGLHMYLDNLSTIWRFFSVFDFIWLAVFLKACRALRMIWMRHEVPSASDRGKTALSNFLTILFVVYFFAIPAIPNFLFTRYFIPLQPVLAVIIIADAAVVYNFAAGRKRGARAAAAAMALICLGCVGNTTAKNIKYIEGHLYELTHRYRGPLDYVIPFIRENYEDTGRLVIATNYEETSFMYYLGAKVVVGFVGNNLEEDSGAAPDLIVYRTSWGNFGDLFEKFLREYRYERIAFPAGDYPMNNLPELNWNPPFIHRFGNEPGSGAPEVQLFVRSGSGRGPAGAGDGTR
ncbi:MAG: hypothetical protein M0Z60_14275 [Nitrospiraceae bacterium]|nr:hypothetical protein [Nitrospiraceae bacterium]